MRGDKCTRKRTVERFSCLNSANFFKLRSVRPSPHLLELGPAVPMSSRRPVVVVTGASKYSVSHHVKTMLTLVVEA